MTATKRSRDTSRRSDDTLAVILAGGAGKRLGGLTTSCAKPALCFGGKYRSIDFTLSNCLHSGIRRVGVLTQFKAHSLIQHIRLAWQFSHPGLGEFIDVWPAQQGPEGNWYRGTADAVYQNIDIIRELLPAYVLILAGDHIYKMNYDKMIRRHIDQSADATIGSIEVPLGEASDFGVISTNEFGRVVSFDEKPRRPRPVPGRPNKAKVSMGIYVFSTEPLLDCLINDARNPRSHHDFGRDILPSLIRSTHVSSYSFRDQNGAHGYWRDIGTIDSFWDTNMNLLKPFSDLDLHDPDWPIWTYEQPLPPAQFRTASGERHGIAVDSLVSNGCVVTGSTVRNSLLSTNVSVEADCQITDSVILPNARIGRGSCIRRAIIDTDCVLPAGSVIGYDAVADAHRYEVSPEGIVLVAQNRAAVRRSDTVSASLPKRRARKQSDHALTSTSVSKALPGDNANDPARRVN